MFKKLLVFILLVAAAVYFIGSSALNKGIQAGVEKFGPQVTQTPVQLESVNLSILSGNGSLSGLYVGNPEGFKSDHIFALGQIDVSVDPASVFSDKIIINKIHIQQPEISYEKTLSGSNLKTLLKNIQAFSGPADATTSEDTAEAPSTEAGGTQKQVLIKQLIIEGGSIYVGLLGAGSKVPLPRIEMNNLGEGDQQKSIPEMLNLILNEVLTSVGPAIAGAGDLLQDGGKAVLNTVKQQGIDSVSEAAGETVQQASEKVSEAADAAVQKASEGLKSLFGK